MLSLLHHKSKLFIIYIVLILIIILKILIIAMNINLKTFCIVILPRKYLDHGRRICW